MMRSAEEATAGRTGSELVLEQVSKSFGAGAPAVDDVSLSVDPHEFVTLLGPSGSGKTTILRMIGGFVSPDGGHILIDGRDMGGVPVERRPTAMLFQQLSLWPHLTVARNVSFGLELRHMPKRLIRDRVDELLSIVGLEHFGQRLPAQLSGGQQQRVALARALALEPRILLLDEPFSALDTKLRVELRTFVRTLQREVGTTTLLVTHDQEEALELSDRIVILRDGHIEQIGSPETIYDAPETGFVAEFLGAMNFLDGTITGGAVLLAGGVTLAVHDGAPAAPLAAGSPPAVGVRPEDVVLEPDPAGAWRADAVTLKGPFKELSLSAGGQSIRAYTGKDLPVGVGTRLHVSLRRLHVFPGERHGPAMSGAPRVEPGDKTARGAARPEQSLSPQALAP